MQLINKIKIGLQNTTPSVDRYISVIMKYPRLTSKFNHARKNLIGTLQTFNKLLTSIVVYADKIERFLFDLKENWRLLSKIDVHGAWLYDFFFSNFKQL